MFNMKKGITWAQVAYSAIEQVCRRMREFVAADVWAVLNKWGMTNKAKDLRSLGGVLNQAKKAGLCVSTDRSVMSNGAYCEGSGRRCNKHRTAVWRSLIYGKKK